MTEINERGAAQLTLDVSGNGFKTTEQVKKERDEKKPIKFNRVIMVTEKVEPTSVESSQGVPKELPKVTIGGKPYFRDDRLEEFRRVDRPGDRPIRFEELSAHATGKEVRAIFGAHEEPKTRWQRSMTGGGVKAKPRTNDGLVDRFLTEMKEDILECFKRTKQTGREFGFVVRLVNGKLEKTGYEKAGHIYAGSKLMIHLPRTAGIGEFHTHTQYGLPRLSYLDIGWAVQYHRKFTAVGLPKDGGLKVQMLAITPKVRAVVRRLETADDAETSTLVEQLTNKFGIERKVKI